MIIIKVDEIIKREYAEGMLKPKVGTQIIQHLRSK